MAGRKSVVAQITGTHRCPQALGQRLTFLDGITHHHPAAGQNHRKLGIRKQLNRGAEAFLATRTALDAQRLWNFALNGAVEIVARNVELGRPHIAHGTVKTTRSELGHAFGVAYMPLVFGEFLEHRQLIGFLEPPQAHAIRSGFRRDDDYRTVCPVSGSNGRDAVADSGAVLTDRHPMAATGTRITIRHVGGALFVHHRNEPDARRRKNIHCVHEGRSHNTEHVGHAIGDHGFDKCFRRRHFLQTLNCLSLVCRLGHYSLL